MKLKHLDDLLSLSNTDFKLVSGSITSPVACVSTPANIKKNSLVFISSIEQWNRCLAETPALVIAHNSLVLNSIPKDVCVLSTGNIKKAMTQVLPLFDRSPAKRFIGTHPTAAVADDAYIGQNVSIGAHSFIGKNVRIGNDCWIGPGVVIEDDSTIGDRTTLRSQVFIGYKSIVGHDCDIHAHTTIGSDGFGFYTDNQYTHTKVPQIGNVVIGDNVEIGANCCVDRGTIQSTTIGNGSKLDNLCHIAHNCTIGENSMIAAGFFIAGSSHLGKRFTTGGNSVVSAQLNIADGVILAGRSTVTNHITEAGQYGGYPLQPLKDALKTISTLGNIVEMRKKINFILKNLSLKD